MNPERAQWLQREPNTVLAKRLRLIAWILTGAVLILVGLMRNPAMHINLPAGWSFAFLPPVHAILNGSVAVCLLFAIVFVKKGNIAWHKRSINAAMILSILFLLCYVAYHFTTKETKYPADAPMRGLYFFFLITHIVLAGVSLPFILLTWISGLTNEFARHRRLAKWVFPMWLYVAVTGPVCYAMLRPYYS